MLCALTLLAVYAPAEERREPGPVTALMIPQSTLETRRLVEQNGAAWFEAQKQLLFRNWLLNDERDPNSFSGAIYAARSAGREPNPRTGDPGEPNYEFHWVRDSALVVSSAASLYEAEISIPEKERYAKAMAAYIRFSRQLQQLPTSHDWMRYENNQIVWEVWSPRENRMVPVNEHTPGAIAVRYGEPKYRVVRKDVTGPDGKTHSVWGPEPYHESWGRPQNDGAALRVTAIADAAKVLQREIERKKILNQDTKAEEEALRQAGSTIVEDMRHIRALWEHPCFDVWEEVLAKHFFTRVVQSEALERGIHTLESLGVKVDPLELQGMKDTHAAIERSLNDFVVDGKIEAFQDQRNGRPPLNSKLDMAVILAALRRRTGPFSASDPRVMATAMALLDHFKNNPRFQDPLGLEKPGVAIGRYPGDAWNGQRRVTDDHGNPIEAGNPWVLTTLAMNEYFLRVAVELQEKGEIVINAQNRRLFEYAFEGAQYLPPQWREALDAGREVRFAVNENPAESKKLFDRLKLRADEFVARLAACGIDLRHATPEQYLVVPRPGNGPNPYHVGAPGLAWNNAQTVRSRNCNRDYHQLAF